MELTELIIKYINNPSDELKKELEKVKKTSSSINIIYAITQLNEIIKTEENEDKKSSLIKIQKEFAACLKDQEENNYIFDEQTNRIVRKR